MDRDLGQLLRDDLDRVAPPLTMDDVLARPVGQAMPSPGPGARIGVAIGTVLALAAALLAVRAPGPTRPQPTVDSVFPVSPSATRGAVPRVLLVGDSVAFSLSFGFEGTPRTASLVSVWNQARYYCELVPAARVESTGKEAAHSIVCDDWQEAWATAVDQFRPDAVLVSIGPWEVFDRAIDGDRQAFGSAALDSRLEATFRSMVAVLSRGGARVLFLTAPPAASPSQTAPAEWTMAERWRFDHLNDVLRRVAASEPDRSGVIDYAAWLCPDVCRTESGGVTLRPDGLHYEKAGAQEVAPWMASGVRTALGLPAG